MSQRTLKYTTRIGLLILSLNPCIASCNEIVALQIPRPVALYLDLVADFEVVAVQIVCPHPDPVVRFQEMTLAEKHLRQALSPLSDMEMLSPESSAARAVIPTLQNSASTRIYHLRLPPGHNVNRESLVPGGWQQLFSQLAQSGNTFVHLSPPVPGIRDPEKHRATLLALLQGEVEKLQNFFGQDTVVTLKGLENPVRGCISPKGTVEIFLEYEIEIHSANTHAR